MLLGTEIGGKEQLFGVAIKESFCPSCGVGRTQLEERGRWGGVVLLYCPACDEEFAPVVDLEPPGFPPPEKPINMRTGHKVRQKQAVVAAQALDPGGQAVVS